VKSMIIIAPLAILVMVLFTLIGGEVVLHLSNWLLLPLVGWRQIIIRQALGLLVLCRILSGGHGWHGYGRSSFRRRMRERCENMTPEERERFRQRFRKRFAERWGYGPSPARARGNEVGGAAC